MSLQVWLPLNVDLHNQGLDNITPLTTTNTSFVSSGKTGFCLKLGYTNDFTVPSLTNGRKISIAYWCKVNTATSTQWLDPIHFYSSDGSTSTVTRQEFYSNCTKTGFWYRSNDVDTTAITNISIEVGKWYHYAATLDYDAGEVAFYVNGQLSTKKTNLNTSHHITGINFKLGENGLDISENDVRIYDHILSPKEIKEISKGLLLHLPLNRNGFGCENLYKGSMDFSGTWGNSSIWTDEGEKYKGFSVRNRSSTWGGLYQDITATLGDKFTISFFARVESGGRLVSVHRSSLGNVVDGLKLIGGNFSGGFTDSSGVWVNTSEDGTDWKYYWGSIEITGDDITYLRWRIENSVANKQLSVAGLKLERGTVPTPWVPHVEDDLYSAMGLDSTDIYDESGFNNNGTKNNIAYLPDSPRYELCSSFNGTNSYIKVTDNKWMQQGATELTISIWGYADDWTTQPKAHLFSCTDSGGFNTEGGNSGYLRFPINVYTAEDKSSRGYKYNSNEVKLSDLTPGWHMFTFIYSPQGNKVYVDGLLHSHYDFVSYGAYYNGNTRLFLGCEASGLNPTGPYFNGRLSDFRIYATELSAEDILALYQTAASLSKNGVLFANEFVEV